MLKGMMIVVMSASLVIHLHSIASGICTQSSHGDQTYYGGLHTSHKQYNKLYVNGAATLTDVTIIDSLTINGALHATNIRTPKVVINGSATITSSDIQYMTVNGAANVAHSTIYQDTKITGVLSATDTTFSNLRVNSKKTVLTDCVVNGDIIISHDSSWSFEIFGWKLFELKSKEKPVVELNNTIVKGKVVFVSSEGIVFASGGNRPACQNGLVAWEPTR